MDKKIEKSPPESEDGNVEYKVSLLGKDRERIEKLVSQMRYRLFQGDEIGEDGECIYKLGVRDNGESEGLTEEEFKETFDVVKTMAKENNCSVSILSKIKVDNVRSIYEILCRQHNQSSYIDLTVCIAGNVDSGKSSTLGTLITGKLDDGRGSSRLSVFNFPHEASSGRTSSTAHHILGFSGEGDIVNYSSLEKKMAWSDIVRKSDKIVSFRDLAGHEKYLKTTISGLTSSDADLCMIMVGANMGLTKMTKEHIFICHTLDIPFVICVTKIDIISNRKKAYEDTMADIKKLLKHPTLRRIPFKVNTDEDIVMCSEKVGTQSIVPLFEISNTTGQGLSELRKFLNILPKRRDSNFGKDVKETLFVVDSVFVVKGIGTVLGGHLKSGRIDVKEELFVGPNRVGRYDKVKIRSIHCKRVPVDFVSNGGYACLAVSGLDKQDVRKGQVVVRKENQLSVSRVTMDMKVMKTHSTTLKVGYEPTLHFESSRQVAKLIEIEEVTTAFSKKKDVGGEDIGEGGVRPMDVLRSGDRARVVFEFKYRREYIKKGFVVFLNEGRTKATGRVLSVE